MTALLWGLGLACLVTGLGVLALGLHMPARQSDEGEG